VKKAWSRLKRGLGLLPGEFVRTLVATVLATALLPSALALLTEDQVDLWVVGLIGTLALLLGLGVGATIGGDSDEKLEAKIRELESRTGELGAYETYAEHVRDALGDLRKVLSDELPSFSTRDFVETGIFEPADKLLQRDHRDAARGDIRFSILQPRREDFVMADASGLLPAHGHRAESRQNFRLPIKDSFAGVAYQTGRVQSSNDLAHDQRFKRHPKATSSRQYESMVSVPLWRSGKVCGVLNVLATRRDAFSAVDRTYITLLASVIDVAESLHPPSDSQY
jgi:hypothetical protein